MSRPLKRHLDGASNGAITRMERELDLAIWTSLGLSYDDIHSPEVIDLIKQADVHALSAEVRGLWPTLVAEERWANLPSVPRELIVDALSCAAIAHPSLITSFVAMVTSLVNEISSHETETSA